MSPGGTNTRRAAIAGLALLAAATASCRRSRSADDPLRLAFFPNLTHAQALVGDAEGRFSAELGKAVSVRLFNAGPAAMEALLAGDVDVAYVGPGPAAIAYLRSHGAALRVVAGAVSGGAQLVARTARTARELVGRRVGSPQIGSTQDISLRAWLRSQGLREGDRRDEVRVVPLSNADIVALFARGEIEAAWVPEPWGARLRAEGGHVLVDERELWHDGEFPTTVVVASRRALESRRGEVVSVLRAHLALTARWRADAPVFARAANLEYGRLVGHPLEPAVLQDAFSRLQPNGDPLRAQILDIAARAQGLGYAPPGDLGGIVDRSLLDEAARTAQR